MPDDPSVDLFWSEEGQDIAEYAVMLAVILVIVVGTIRLVWFQRKHGLLSGRELDSVNHEAPTPIDTSDRLRFATRTAVLTRPFDSPIPRRKRPAVQACGVLLCRWRPWFTTAKDCSSENAGDFTPTIQTLFPNPVI